MTPILVSPHICKSTKILQFLQLCPLRSGHNVPINLQQDKCYSLFYNFVSLYEWETVIP